MAAEAVFIDAEGRVSIMEDRRSMYIGRLVPSMRKMAAKCSRAVVILMAGSAVADCKDVEYVNLAAVGGR
jgi:hypothetical protein